MCLYCVSVRACSTGRYVPLTLWAEQPHPRYRLLCWIRERVMRSARDKWRCEAVCENILEVLRRSRWKKRYCWGQNKKANPWFSPERFSVSTEFFSLQREYFSSWRFSPPKGTILAVWGFFLWGKGPHTAKMVPLGRENLWRDKISFERENLPEENLTDLPFCFDLDNIGQYMRVSVKKCWGVWCSDVYNRRFLTAQTEQNRKGRQDAPLAQLTILTPCLHLAMVTSSIRLLVSFVSGVCTVMKSLFAQMSSRSALSIPTWPIKRIERINRGEEEWVVGRGRERWGRGDVQKGSSGGHKCNPNGEVRN